MDYRNLSWHDLRSFATSQGIDTRKKKKRTILEELDGIQPKAKKLEPFKGIKETHPLFEELEEYLPYLKAFKKIKAVSSIDKVNTAIATLFMKYIEEHKSAAINLSCGKCKPSYYERMIAGYNKLAIEYERECI